MTKICAFIPYLNGSVFGDLIQKLSDSPLIEKMFIFSKLNLGLKNERVEEISIDHFKSTNSIKVITELAESEFVLLVTKPVEINLGPYSLERFLRVAQDTQAGILYSNYYEVKNDITQQHPTIDYQLGSIRDDFDFGPLLFINSTVLKNAASSMIENLSFSGLFNLRLNISQSSPILRIPEYLYTSSEPDLRNLSEKQFDYVNPDNSSTQIELEKVATDHLKKINAFLRPTFKTIDLMKSSFDTEASIIIPVKNRIKTIGGAVESALKQKTNFSFNIIVVDNHSIDGTAELLRILSEKHKQLIHIIPSREDLLIGGCWNEAVNNKACGKFAVQLDSDDIYYDENTLLKIIDTFYREKCAMVIGAYVLTDFSLNQIPPGLIDHKEWSDDNGPNNALRINGLGAPRAFYAPLLREIKIPNVSYGEDYYLGIAISREYKIGRIYEPIYFCRRWEENTDSVLDINKLNLNNFYKDRLRTFEILTRQKINSSK